MHSGLWFQWFYASRATGAQIVCTLYAVAFQNSLWIDVIHDALEVRQGVRATCAALFFSALQSLRIGSPRFLSGRSGGARHSIALTAETTSRQTGHFRAFRAASVGGHEA
jgi:hypothetical protein